MTRQHARAAIAGWRKRRFNLNNVGATRASHKERRTQDLALNLPTTDAEFGGCPAHWCFRDEAPDPLYRESTPAPNARTLRYFRWKPDSDRRVLFWWRSRVDTAEPPAPGERVRIVNVHHPTADGWDVEFELGPATGLGKRSERFCTGDAVVKEARPVAS